jgi:DNA-binding response OmpR family regulator
VCRQLALRQPPLGVPIILVSALAEESSVVSGLDSGADDYVIKPFRRAEFLARIRGKLQLANAGEAPRQVGGARRGWGLGG